LPNFGCGARMIPLGRCRRREERFVMQDKISLFAVLFRAAGHAFAAEQPGKRRPARVRRFQHFDRDQTIFLRRGTLGRCRR
jgi:hypothetical protein